MRVPRSQVGQKRETRHAHVVVGLADAGALATDAVVEVLRGAPGTVGILMTGEPLEGGQDGVVGRFLRFSDPAACNPVLSAAPRTAVPAASSATAPDTHHVIDSR